MQPYMAIPYPSYKVINLTRGLSLTQILTVKSSSISKSYPVPPNLIMLKFASEEDLKRKLTSRSEILKKEAVELLKITAQSSKEIQELVSSVEKQHEEYTASKDPSDKDFLKIALNLDRTKNMMILILAKSREDSPLWRPPPVTILWSKPTRRRTFS